MNPKIVGGVQIACAIFAVLLGFIDQIFFALILLAIALIITGIDKFAEGGAPAPAMRAPVREAYPPRQAMPPGAAGRM